jgi:hypothetical protein
VSTKAAANKALRLDAYTMLYSPERFAEWHRRHGNAPFSA